MEKNDGQYTAKEMAVFLGNAHEKIQSLQTSLKDTEKKLKKAVKFIKEVQEYFKPPQDTHSTMIGIDELLESFTPTREK